MKKLFLLLAAATLVAACSKDAEEFEEFDNFPQIVDGPTITVETPGTLAELLARFDAEAITELTVMGNLNDDDIVALRDNLPNLAVLDMESVDLEELPDKAFDSKKSLTAVRLPKNLKTIGNYAFDRCSNLTSMTIPQSVTRIGYLAFSGCKSWTGKLVIPEGVRSIESSAFKGCSGLTGELVLPQGVTSIGSEAFEGCSGLTGELVIPKGVTWICTATFRNCSGLTGVVFPEYVSEIESSAFKGCSGLTSVTFPQRLKLIYKSAFNGCNNVTAYYCKATVPPTFYFYVDSPDNAFSDPLNYAAPLYVPVGTAETYKSAMIWKKFENIVEKKF